MPKEVKDTKTKVTKKVAAASKTGRALTPYNAFMKSELPKVKALQPSITHREAFKVAAGNWKNSAENPANKK
ncbi:hypothetical protein BASA61_010377 [Batrachochytrium salamandrivorans]|nr:hypothetical protein BASA62_003661 [Batrachochytrium salamandrivorans]KAH6579243.1 hypothetical protein BASA61_010377 [Batrachochytrium salamandrivorans]KAJ1340993.1 hypothetical protein BSLG_004466 [Batrachochytrium salamandrivorans]